MRMVTKGLNHRKNESHGICVDTYGFSIEIYGNASRLMNMLGGCV